MLTTFRAVVSGRSLGASRIILAFTLATQLAVGQQWVCRYPAGHPQAGQAWEGLKRHGHFAYIPGDNIVGGTPCYWTPYPGAPYGTWFSQRYKADGNPVTEWGVTPARVMHMQFMQYGYQQGDVKAASETRAYGYGSPANGSTISYADEDGRWYDCFLFQASDIGSTINYMNTTNHPFPGQAQSRVWGSGSNPLESTAARITWDVNAIFNYQNLDYVTAYANITHSCFPAHVVNTNNKTLYHYRPPSYDQSYIFSCLVLQQGQTQGLVWGYPGVQVPCN
jgi:hypothetical protein